ncbi:hypothetical protein B0A50_01188 [Salinomyces thailandicus]|uniref:Uncharacterized protein n=1 Tax=Salinomyces thailandicus TaxID=706561 RepID=A0A4U0U9C4_9PEZI|nr:hypothetical protein B0A50_01188 [Salinomyces thailandica]
MPYQPPKTTEENALSNRGGALLFFLVLLTALNTATFILASVASGTIDYLYLLDESSHRWYSNADPNQATHRVALFFFYATLPLLLTLLSAYSTLKLYRTHGRLSPLSLTLASATGLALWILQLSLTGSCTWTDETEASALSKPNIGSGPAWCPFALQRTWGYKVVKGMPWVGVVGVVLYTAHLLTAALALKKHGRAGPPEPVNDNKKKYDLWDNAADEEVEMSDFGKL